MKIALFSDIHANLPAFEAFLKDLDSRQPDSVYCLGDLIGYNIWPNEIISGIRQRAIATLAGNHDQKSKGYAYELVDSSNRKYLNALPAHIKLDYQTSDQPFNMVLAHGSTRSIDEYVLEDMDENYVLQMMSDANADILCVGHSHKPYRRVIKTAAGDKHVVNVGSVGKPKDGNPAGCYVMLTINRSDAPGISECIGVEFIRFEYDVEKAARAIEQSPLPDELAERLRKAW